MSTAAARLRPHRDVLLRQLRNFGRVRRELVSAVVEILEQQLCDRPKRTAAALKASQERSEVIEQGIRRAVGAVPLSTRGLAGLIRRRIERRPDVYGLVTTRGKAQVPCLTIIRRVLAAMRAEQDAK